MSTDPPEMPDVIRRAIEAQGKTTPDAVLSKLAYDAQIPTDAEEQHRQEIETARPVEEPHGTVCADCANEVDWHDKHALREVTGWHRPREAGGQNHVIARVETGRVMCGTCAIKLKAGLPVEQQSLV